MRKFQLVALILLGTSVLIPFPTATVAQRAESKGNQDANTTQSSLPSWFQALDRDGDGQVTLHEWRIAGRSIDEFDKYDLNGDGMITEEEVRRFLKTTDELKLNKGQGTYTGTIEEAADKLYRGKKSFKILTIKLERGNTYQIDYTSQAFQAFLYLEDSDANPMEENGSPTVGGNSRIVFRADKTGTYRLIATSQAGIRTGNFSLSVRSGVQPKALPPWFQALDKDGAGQVTLHEWRKARKPIGEFDKYDLNGDGMITAEEVRHLLKTTDELRLVKGQATYNGAVEEAIDELYRGKKSFKILTIKLDRGKTYQIDHISQAFQAYLYLEDSDGNLLEENGSTTIGGNSRIVFRADKTGTYRLIATSQGGFRTGNFSLSARSGVQPKALPPWFQALDRDGDGQVTLHEWRTAGRSVEEFDKYDLNGDGMITAEEILLCLKATDELKLNKGQGTYTGTIEESANEPYRGKKSFKILTIKLERGKTYQIVHTSEAFQAFLYLEDSDGNLLKENSSRNVGGNARIVFRANKTGTYRLIATSQAGVRTGEFSLSVRLGALP
jgi:Ca2+-binding EF-hand superfamily protein